MVKSWEMQTNEKWKINKLMHTYKEITKKEMVVVECYQTMVTEGMMAWIGVSPSEKR